MAERYFRLREIIELCGVNPDFVQRLEEENLILPIMEQNEKLYPMEEVDRVRVARVLFEELGVNFEGIEVALHMREQMIGLQREVDKVLRSIIKETRKE